MIKADGLTKSYGKSDNLFSALSDITFTIASDSTLAIVGKSGSGKSTLMHILSGLDSPTSGSVMIDEVDLFKMKVKDIDNFRSQKMSFIFQAFFIEANQSCFQNVMLPLEIARVPIYKRKKLVMEALTAVELDPKTNEPAGNLSGGQKQRLAIARAIVNKPRFLFADEPTGNLDSVTGEKVMNLLFGLNKKIKCTLVLVTHDADLAKRCQTQISLRDGKIAEIKDNKKTVVVT